MSLNSLSRYDFTEYISLWMCFYFNLGTWLLLPLVSGWSVSHQSYPLVPRHPHSHPAPGEEGFLVSSLSPFLWPWVARLWFIETGSMCPALPVLGDASQSNLEIQY